MASKVKGMVQLAGVTYRIVRVAQGAYSVVRISDDVDVGRFHLAPALAIEPSGVEPALLREVARLAIHTAKTSYAGFARPDLAGLEVASANASRRSPSSLPSGHSTRGLNRARGRGREFRRSFDRRCRAHDAVCAVQGRFTQSRGVGDAERASDVAELRQLLAAGGVSR